MQNKKILVVGSGISGLTSALALLRAGHDVTIISREKPGTFPHTSLSAYAMWVPVAYPDDDRFERWAFETCERLVHLADLEGSGVRLRSICVLKTEQSEPWYAGKMTNFRHGASGEFSAQYADAHVLDGAPVIDPAKHLPWLYRQVVTAGGTFRQQEVATFDAVAEGFDVVVNCSGLGSRELASDKTLFGERVQVVTVRQTGFDKVIIDDEGPNKRACVVPHDDYIKLGAVFDGAVESLDVDLSLTADILARCNAMAPELNVSLDDVISVVRAHRPERSAPRVELETLASGVKVFHNYGHDGMGYLLSYGIADEIAATI